MSKTSTISKTIRISRIKTRAAELAESRATG